MDWDLLLVTGALIGVFMLLALLGRIWQDETPREPEDEAKKSCEMTSTKNIRWVKQSVAGLWDG